MITGFNTDIPYDGVTYHVQTEDKGLDTPLILSLVYVGGAIIASKRTPYEDLVGRGFNEQELTERLQRQHKLICAAVKAGRIADLKRMAQSGGAQAQAPEPQAGGVARAKSPGGRRKKPEASAPPAEESAAAPAEETTVPSAEETTVPPAEELITLLAGAPTSPTEEAAPLQAEPPPEETAPAPATAAAVKAEPEIEILTTLADEINALEDLTPRLYQKTPAPVAPPAPEPPAPVVVVPETPAPAPLLTAEAFEAPLADSDEIYMTLLDDEGEFRAGQLATIKVYVGRGAYGRRPEIDASVMVKVLGTSFRPLILTALTDAQGVGVVRALIPRFTSGRAAIIIRASKGDDAAEMRRIIHQ